jgi:hypothetical protein
LKHPTFSKVQQWSRSKKGRVVVAEDGLFKDLLELPLLCYPYIPPTLCAVKDWEKWDDDNSRSIPTDFFKGFVSSKLNPMSMAPVILSPEEQGNTIESDLEVRSHGIEDLDFVFLAQGPPANTPLDMVDADHHVGSTAIKKFIIETAPQVSLHGHAHASPYHSKRYFTKVGKTISINPGQSPADSKLPCHYVTFNLDNVLGSLNHSTFGPAV